MSPSSFMFILDTESHSVVQAGMELTLRAALTQDLLGLISQLGPNKDDRFSV